MSDSYGSGLNFNVGGGEGPPGGSFAPDVQPTPNDGPPVPADQPPASPQQAGPSFGASIRSVFGGPNYKAPDPETTALDQSASLLEQRVKRANEVATNPLADIFAPEQAAAAREFVPKAVEQLQTIEKQKSAIQAGRVQAQTLGLAPGEVSDQATQEDRLTIAKAKALKGDLRSFQGIQAVSPEHAAAIAPQVFEVVSGHLTKAQFAFDSLASMQNEGQYQAKVRELKQNGTLADLESLGLKLPPSYDAFQGSKALEARALREARIGINTQRQQLEDRNTYQPMEKKEAETYAGRQTTVYGDQVTNGTWSRNAASGTRGLVVNGLGTVDALGKGGTLGDKDQRKELGEELRAAIPTTELEKMRAFNRTYTLAEPTEAQKKKGDTVNTNPNVQQGIAEGLASMLRGGGGGANVGLLKIEVGKRGVIQGVIDTIRTEYAGAYNEIAGKDIKPYLTHLTQNQMREVLDGLKQWNDRSLDDRAQQIARRAGALGFDVSALGFGQSEAKGAIANAIEEGRQAQIARMRPGFQAIGGGDGVLQLVAQAPGAESAPLPGGTTPTNQLPGAAPLLTPVQQAGNNNPPPASPGATAPGAPVGTVTRPEGAPPPTQPATVAGQQVTLPPGISPEYVQFAQRVESGGTKDPWKATTGGSSASGAFQFTNQTWKENKPAGAPDRAKDATPQQQIEGLATLTGKIDGTLKTLNLPQTDVNRYILHNLGLGGGASLLKASPDADARAIVGEDAAKNNPRFFKGRPTVATVLQRYADAGNEPTDEGGGPKTPAPGGAAAAAKTIIPRAVLQAAPGGAAMLAAWDALTPAQKEKVKDFAIDEAPAIGSTAGAVVGGALGNVPGGIAGGAVGGAAGQSLKDYLKGNEQNPREIVKQGALGAVLGVGGLPRGLNTVARVAGAGGVAGGAEATKEGSDAEKITDAALETGGAALGGELFGRALGMVGHKVYNMFAPDARKAVQAAAKNYSEATEVLNTQQPKITSATGSVPNPEYMAAEVKRTKAEQILKDAGLKPEEAAYAHEVSSQGVPKQEAQAGKPGALEQQRVGEGYQQIEREVGDKGVGAVKETPKPLQDGPITAVISGKVPKAFGELAQKVENEITAPAANWQEKWVQLKETRSVLLEAERDALSSTADRKGETASAYRELANTVRTQQTKAAHYVFGSKEGDAVMERLKTLDVRYRRLMEATNNGDLAKAAAMKGEAGREADRRFRAFAGNDHDAIAAWDAMRKASQNVERDVLHVVAAERLPVLGKVVSGMKLLGSFNRWMAEREAGSAVKFSEILNSAPDVSARTVRDAVGSVGARAATQGDFSALAPQ